MVSVLFFCSDDQSLDPLEAKSFNSKQLFEKKENIETMCLFCVGINLRTLVFLKRRLFVQIGFPCFSKIGLFENGFSNI